MRKLCRQLGEDTQSHACLPAQGSLMALHGKTHPMADTPQQPLMKSFYLYHPFPYLPTSPWEATIGGRTSNLCNSVDRAWLWLCAEKPSLLPTGVGSHRRTGTLQADFCVCLTSSAAFLLASAPSPRTHTRTFQHAFKTAPSASTPHGHGALTWALLPAWGGGDMYYIFSCETGMFLHFPPLHWAGWADFLLWEEEEEGRRAGWASDRHCTMLANSPFTGWPSFPWPSACSMASPVHVPVCM